MSLVFIECDSNVNVAVGLLVVIDSTSLKARHYNSGTDSASDIIGVSYPKKDTTARIVSNFDGLGFCDYDYYSFTEQLSYVQPLTANPNFSSFDPVNSTSPYYCCVALSGMVPVLNTESDIPSAWKKIRTGTNYDIYLAH